MMGESQEAGLLANLLTKNEDGTSYSIAIVHAPEILSQTDANIRIEIVRRQFEHIGAFRWTKRRFENLACKLGLDENVLWAMIGIFTRKGRRYYRFNNKLPPHLGYLLCMIQQAYDRPKSLKRIRFNKRAIAGNLDRVQANGQGQRGDQEAQGP